MATSSPGRIPSSPPKGISMQEELAYYKAQYEQVELELQEFQASSKELEAELEKDIEESEKRERDLREKAESLRFEVDEWKTKYKQSKSEASNAQNSLQKEITTLRDTNRTLQFKLRDIEVANDDFERQARHQTSSLEDLESKYNVAVERGIMLEEEIRTGEKEREDLRIESQRLRDELSDIRVELEVTQDKLRHAEDTLERDRARKVTPIATDSLRPPSPMSESSTSATTVSSPSACTPPPAKSDTSTLQTSPPSPPTEAIVPTRKPNEPFTPLATRKRIIPTATTPRPSLSGIRPPRHSRGPSIPQPTPTAVRTGLPPKTPRKQIGRPSIVQSERAPPRSESLHQIRGLIGKMQKLEQRVHSARSKLPAPTATPPRSSPRSSLAMGGIPSTVTVRSARKRSSQSTATSNFTAPSTEPRPSSRLSFGFKAPDQPARPESRTSYVSSQFARPSSRASGRGTPMEMHRPRSSISGSFASTQAKAGDGIPRATTPGPKGSSGGHMFSRSVSSAVGGAEGLGALTPLTARRTTLDRNGTGIPPPSGLPRRQSGGVRRLSGATDGGGSGEMRPPSARGRRLSGVGETF